MLLKWNPERLKVVPVLPSQNPKDPQPKRGEVVFLPGYNEIDDDEWLLIKGLLADEMARGDLSTMTTKVGDGPGKAKEATSLLSWPTNRVKDIINDTHSPETLQMWENNETRPEVRLMIQKRMDFLKIIPTPDVQTKTAAPLPPVAEE